MSGNPVGWFEIYVQDMARARDFYEAVFVVRLTALSNPDPVAFPEMEMWAFPAAMDRFGASGALVRMPDMASGAGGTLIYFSCVDCATYAERAVKVGGTLISPKTSLGEHGYCALVRDPDGNVIGLHSMR
ncbi:MAG: VOC family protein [Xanthomonadales bacterium]|jgi:hypothetical protein|nr:VOC family protein [Xanthomonadales bacterium]